MWLGITTAGCLQDTWSCSHALLRSLSWLCCRVWWASQSFPEFSLCLNSHTSRSLCWTWALQLRLLGPLHPFSSMCTPSFPLLVEDVSEHLASGILFDPSSPSQLLQFFEVWLLEIDLKNLFFSFFLLEKFVFFICDFRLVSGPCLCIIQPVLNSQQKPLASSCLKPCYCWTTHWLPCLWYL